jgi:thiamine-monophosphate kinase
LAEGKALCGSGAVTSLIDISDGLASELHHLASSSAVGLLIDEKAIPITASTRAGAKALGADPLAWALGGGEDYELLFTFRPEQAAKIGVPYHVLGEVTLASQGVRWKRSDGRDERLPLVGWDHFAR